MPRWICPSCNATMTVKPSHIGQTAACVSCGKKSEVTDSDAIANMLQDDPPAEVRPPGWVPPRGESVCDLAKGMLMTAVFLMVAGGVLTLNRGGPGVALLVSAVVLVVQMILIWPFYTMADDTRANRRLLDQIVKRERE